MVRHRGWLPALAVVAVIGAGCSPAGMAYRGRPNGTPAPTRSAAAAMHHCQRDELHLRLGGKAAVPDAGSQYRVPLVFTNIGHVACTLRGFPTVELRGPADPNGVGNVRKWGRNDG